MTYCALVERTCQLLHVHISCYAMLGLSIVQYLGYGAVIISLGLLSCATSAAFPPSIASGEINSKGLTVIAFGTETTKIPLAMQQPYLLPWRSCNKRQMYFRPGQSLTSSSRSSKRSLATDLTASGFRFIFSQIDVIASSALAYRYTTEFYRNLTTVVVAERRSSPAPQKLVIAYGALKLTAVYTYGQGLTEELLAHIIVRFAEHMLDTLAVIVIGAFRLAIFMEGDVRVLLGMEIGGTRN